MNLYIRYFDNETLVTNVDDALYFLDQIDEIGLNDKIANDVRNYFESDVRFPKRYKVRPKIYFIMIKTDANNMKEFKEYRNNSVNKANNDDTALDAETEADNNEQQIAMHRERQSYNSAYVLQEERFGWYEGTYTFKRVVINPSTGKNEYRDTRFIVQCKAMSGLDCYNRMIDYLQTCVDNRSQFPSAKGRNFSFAYLGRCKETQE